VEKTFPVKRLRKICVRGEERGYKRQKGSYETNQEKTEGGSKDLGKSHYIKRRMVLSQRGWVGVGNEGGRTLREVHKKSKMGSSKSPTD